jgi:hypothetical protein
VLSPHGGGIQMQYFNDARATTSYDTVACSRTGPTDA